MFDEKVTFLEHANIIKKKTYLFSIITLSMIFVILCLTCSKLELNIYILWILEIILIIVSFYKIRNYYNVKKIKSYLIKHNLIDKIGNIDFTDGDNYYLMEYYIIFLYKKQVLCFDYSKIEKVFKEYYNIFNLGASNRNHVDLYLHFVLKNGIEFKILTDSSADILLCTTKNSQNIINYLLTKNSEIIIENEVLKNEFSLYK